MIKVLAAALIGTVVGIAVMVVVIAVSTSSPDNSSSLGLSLSQPVATTTPATSQPSSGGSSTGGNSALIDQGKTLFSSNGCSGCHTLAAAGATGTIGPDLDKQLVSDAQAAGMPLDAFVKESIVNPDAYIAKGFSKGIMPTSFSSLSPADIDALVALITSGKS